MCLDGICCSVHEFIPEELEDPSLSLLIRELKDKDLVSLSVRVQHIQAFFWTAFRSPYPHPRYNLTYTVNTFDRALRFTLMKVGF